MDRVYRIGQTREVRVVRFIGAGTIEERIVEVQESKTLLGLAALNQVPSPHRANSHKRYLYLRYLHLWR